MKNLTSPNNPLKSLLTSLRRGKEEIGVNRRNNY